MDIRSYFMATPKRKRIIESDDEDDAAQTQKLQHPDDNLQQIQDRNSLNYISASLTDTPKQPERPKVSKPTQINETITIDDSSDENAITEPGFSVIMKPTEASAPTSTADEVIKPMATQRRKPQPTSRSGTPTKGAGKKTIKPTPTTRKTTSKNSSPGSNKKRAPRARKLEAEASESSAETDDASCDESDPNAKLLYPTASDMYKSTIVGVRNKSAALQDWRATTTPCPICARFETFLQFFKR
jgi:hypothetical protein